MFAVKRGGAVERSFGEFAVGEKGHGCARLGVERETTVDQNSYPRVGYRLPCLRLGAFLGLGSIFNQGIEFDYLSVIQAESGWRAWIMGGEFWLSEA